MYGSSLLCGGMFFNVDTLIFFNVDTLLTTDLVLVLEVNTLEIKHELQLDHPVFALQSSEGALWARLENWSLVQWDLSDHFETV